MMESFEEPALIWLLWGGVALGMQAAVSLCIRRRTAAWQRQVFPLLGLVFYLACGWLLWRLNREPDLLFQALLWLLAPATLVSIALFGRMLQTRNWCGACLRVHCANALLLVAVWEGWESVSSNF
jgi:hypothetical protein